MAYGGFSLSSYHRICWYSYIHFKIGALTTSFHGSRHLSRLRNLRPTSRDIKSNLREEEVLHRFPFVPLLFISTLLLLVTLFFANNRQMERLITGPGFVWLTRTKTNITRQNIDLSFDLYPFVSPWIHALYLLNVFIFFSSILILIYFNASNFFLSISTFECEPLNTLLDK